MMSDSPGMELVRCLRSLTLSSATTDRGNIHNLLRQHHPSVEFHAAISRRFWLRGVVGDGRGKFGSESCAKPNLTNRHCRNDRHWLRLIACTTIAKGSVQKGIVQQSTRSLSSHNMYKGDPFCLSILKLGLHQVPRSVATCVW